jgi:hypothetical protein
MQNFTFQLYTDVSDSITYYQTDFKDSYNPSNIECEWRLWRSEWKLFCLNSSNSIPKNAIEALKKCNKDEFPTNICSVENIMYHTCYYCIF